MGQQIYVKRDTKSWIFQVWAAFIISALMCAYGVLNVPMEGINQAFLATGIFFVLFSSFVLAKSLRDNQVEKVDTPMWRMQVWVGFGVSVALTAWGFATMQLNSWQLGYMISSTLFLISSTFTLSKTIRDQHDANLLEQSGKAE